jgi:hypothetical protein
MQSDNDRNDPPGADYCCRYLSRSLLNDQCNEQGASGKAEQVSS